MKITITHGSKEIHGARVLKDVNMTLESGAVYGFLGKNGSGKTMLMRAVCGLIGLTEGNIDVDGITIGKGQDFPSKLGMLRFFCRTGQGTGTCGFWRPSGERPPRRKSWRRWSRRAWIPRTDEK